MCFYSTMPSVYSRYIPRYKFPKSRSRNQKIYKMIRSSREDILAMRSSHKSSQRSNSSKITIQSWPTVNNLTKSRCRNFNRRTCAEKLIGFFLLLLTYFFLWACFYRDVQAQRKDWEFLRYKIICNSISEAPFHCKLFNKTA